PAVLRNESSFGCIVLPDRPCLEKSFDHFVHMVSGYRMRQGILAVRRKSFQGHEVCNCPDSAAPVFAFLGIAGCVGRQTGYPVMTSECIGVGKVSTKPVNPIFWYYASQQRPIRANRLNIRQ